MMKSKKYWSILFVVFLAACTYSFPEIEQASEQDLGELNTNKVVAFGDGFLAGAMDGALFTEGQSNSVASILVSQISNSKEIDFIQAEINSENGFNFYESTENEIHGKWIYQFSGLYEEEPERILTNGESVSDFPGDKSAIQDFSIPMLKMKNIEGTFLFENPYFSRCFNTDDRIVNQLIAKNPSLILCWLGINDYLQYAIQGASDEKMLTTVSEFQNNFENLVNEILQNSDAKILIGNLIPINDLPFFYLNQYNFIRLSNVDKGNAQGHYSAYNMAVAAFNVGKPREDWRPMISFEDNGATLYPQAVVVIDNNLPDAFYSDGTPLEKYRQLNENEIALFSITESMVEEGFGSTIPLSDEYYLTESQIEKINSRTEAFNQIIENFALQHSDRIAFVDVKSTIAKIAQTGRIDSWGIPESDELLYYNGVPLEGRIGQNSIFSLDAVHFNQRGNAYLANEFIKATNAGFNSNIALVDINNYTGNVFTFDF